MASPSNGPKAGIAPGALDVDHNQEVREFYSLNFKTSVVEQNSIGFNAEDYDENGALSLSEFCDLIKAFGNRVSDKELESVFEKIDQNKDGRVSAEELAELITVEEDRTMLLKRCPVCGESLGSTDELNDVIHMSLCFDEGIGDQIMT